MQLGTRWRFGTPPPQQVPVSLCAAIRHYEASAQPDTENSNWTLTWLEGRPQATLNGVDILTVQADGDPIWTVFNDDPAEQNEDDDDWLE
jgi:hypothetical protein